MNIDFAHNATFSSYVLLLMFSGVVTLVFASPAFRRASALLRAVNAVAGILMFGYGFYLAFIFSGGHYYIFFKAFIVPAFLIANTLRSSAARRPDPGRLRPLSHQPASPVSSVNPMSYSTRYVDSEAGAGAGSRHAAAIEQAPNPAHVRLGDEQPRRSSVGAPPVPAHAEVGSPSPQLGPASDAADETRRYVPPRPREATVSAAWMNWDADADTGPIDRVRDSRP